MDIVRYERWQYRKVQIQKKLENIWDRWHNSRIITTVSSARIAFIIQLIFFAVLAVINLAGNSYCNEYYAAAAQAGAHSWKAFLYGTLDFSATITVDKPPASLWLPSLSIRIFGLSPWALLLPEVGMYLLCMCLIYCSVKSHYGALSGWLASFFFASTPIGFVMFRYNNPEALMILLMVAMACSVDIAIRRSTQIQLLAQRNRDVIAHNESQVVAHRESVGKFLPIKFFHKFLPYRDTHDNVTESSAQEIITENGDNITADTAEAANRASLTGIDGIDGDADIAHTDDTVDTAETADTPSTDATTAPEDTANTDDTAQKIIHSDNVVDISDDHDDSDRAEEAGDDRSETTIDYGEIESSAPTTVLHKDALIREGLDGFGLVF